MEAVAERVSSRSLDLSSPALRAPQHEPGGTAVQPCNLAALHIGKSSSHIETIPAAISVPPLMLIDSAQSSCHVEENSRPKQVLSQQSPVANLGNTVDANVGDGAAQPSVSPDGTIENGGPHGQETQSNASDLLDGDEGQSTSPTGRPNYIPETVSSAEVPSCTISCIATRPNSIVKEVSTPDAPPKNDLPAMDETPNTMTQPSTNCIKEGATRSTSPDRVSIMTEQHNNTKISFWKRYKITRSQRRPELKVALGKAQLETASTTRSSLMHHRSSPNPARDRSSSISDSRQNVENFDSQVARTNSQRSATITSPEYVVSQPLDSKFLYYLEEEKMYVAKLKDISPPVSLQQKWWPTTRKRLVLDLHQGLKSLHKNLTRDEAMIEPEFCMSGRADSALQTVQLRPSIWIRCGSKICRECVRKSVGDLSYLSGSTIHFRLDAPIFATHLTTGQTVGIILGTVLGLPTGIIFILGLTWRMRRKDRNRVPPSPPMPGPPALMVEQHGQLPWKPPLYQEYFPESAPSKT